jgi:hypothetical protein
MIDVAYKNSFLETLKNWREEESLIVLWGLKEFAPKWKYFSGILFLSKFM